MKPLKTTSHPEVKNKFDQYPSAVREKMEKLRKIIIETAEETEDIHELEETLKWGEPSYLTKKGSTVRMDWKSKKPDQYAMYFKCTSKLVSTFKSLYGDTFNYEKNRAIVFKISDTVPETELKHCISLALTYHKIKHLPLLGGKI